ncbi:MAG: TlpA disulfide reductase family protein [Polyangiaceae bacterium]
MTISSWARRATSSGLGAALAAVAACGGSTGAPLADDRPGISKAEVHAPIDFSYDSVDERPVSSEATRGKPTVITFITTGSLPAQAQVDFLVVMARHDADKVNYAAVALEARENREIVELYKKALSIPFPVALADETTTAGGGPFGDVTGVPATVVLDRTGRIVLRVAGRVVKSDELRGALRGL